MTSAGASYLVKLVRTYDDRDVLVVFIVGGQPFSTNVPVGVYALRYAAGPHEQWISEQHRFGYDTSYAKADRILGFTIDGGKTVELILQRGGNLPTSRISRDQF